MEKEKKPNKSRELLAAYRLYILIPAWTIALVFVSALILIIVFAFTNLIGFLIALLVIAALTLVAYIIFYFNLSKRLKVTYYDQLFKTTYTNMSKLKNNDTSLLSYGDSDIKEIQQLDKITYDIKQKFDNAFLIVKSPSYEKLNLEYVDREKNLITYKSFRDNIANIVFLSQSFRNLIIEVYFNLPNEVVLNDADKKRLFDLYMDAFKEHEGSLFMVGEEGRSIVIYVPVIDSFSEIKEKLSYIVSNSSIMVRDDRGIKHIIAQYALVAYPFSNEEMILGDLRYAKRQNKPYFLFIPQRFKTNLDKKLLFNTSMNLNYMSKVISALGELDYSSMDNSKNYHVLKQVFNAIADFLDIDEAGIITYNETDRKYYPYVNSDRSSLFIKDEVKSSFIEALGKAVDEDGTYYFSTRRHANYSIERAVDLYGISSGCYFIVHNFQEDRIDAIIYLFNRNKDFFLNTYLRETFFIMGLRIENYFEKQEIANYAETKHTENEHILALSHMYVYHIDEEYKITYISSATKKKFPNLNKGEYCYKALFGHDKQCIDCPFKTRKRKIFETHKEKFESSLLLADRRDKNRVMLIRRVEKDESVGDLFENDLLVYSFKSFVDSVKNEYASSARGYMVLLSIDNADALLEKHGSEGYAFIVREYIRNLKYKLRTNDIYFYNPTTLAIHLPYNGHADIIDKIETIYPLSKESFDVDKHLEQLSITYLPVGYPRGYAYPEDYLKHISDFYRSSTYDHGKDFIYFADYSISRCASKRDFMISVLESEFSGHNSKSMNLQPIVSVKDGRIFGAEILLRIADAHRNVFFNAEEISRLAEEENKTQLITESIINFIGEMYKEYGNNVFRINHFNRIAINIDQTYLKDQSLLPEIVKLSVENKLPSGFISMEVPEDIIPNNKEQIKALADALSKYHILFSCDRYMGQYVDIEELRDLGFKEVKIARDIILNIDKDPVKLDTVSKIVVNSKKQKLAVAAVGVENEQQYKLLRGLDEEMSVQGFYLYKPLVRSDLINALISYEK